MPSARVKYLGLIVDSEDLSFEIPLDKREIFEGLRLSILQNDFCSIKTLQRLAGKCVSFSLVFPGALLYTREMHSAIGQASRNSRDIRIVSSLKEEIEFWEFLKDQNAGVKWRSESHAQISVMTDASLYKWGGVLNPFTTDQQSVSSDFWAQSDARPIHMKEAEGLRRSILAFAEELRGKRVDAYVDNQAVVHGWNNKGSRNLALTGEMKLLFQLSVDLNIDLGLRYVASKDNLADAPSRALSPQDACLSPRSWERVQARFGPHTVDLMSLDSNVMVDMQGKPLRHFTPFPTPGSSGVNLFATDIKHERNPYVFPPIIMISPVLKFLRDSGISACTVVVPDFHPRPLWWTLLQSRMSDLLVLGHKGQKQVLRIPTKKGLVLDLVGLPWNLIAVRLQF
jgi:hypothetical protein